jgi:hypothetical protein
MLLPGQRWPGNDLHPDDEWRYVERFHRTEEIH